MAGIARIVLIVPKLDHGERRAARVLTERGGWSSRVDPAKEKRTTGILTRTDRGRSKTPEPSCRDGILLGSVHQRCPARALEWIRPATTCVARWRSGSGPRSFRIREAHLRRSDTSPNRRTRVDPLATEPVLSTATQDRSALSQIAEHSQ